jgi:hypothetical protein
MMSDIHTTNRRAGRGARIVRASTVAVSLAASVGLQFVGHDDKTASQSGMAANPSIACAVDANGSFAVL